MQTFNSLKPALEVVPSFIVDLRECEIDTIRNNVITTTTGY